MNFNFNFGNAPATTPTPVSNPLFPAAGAPAATTNLTATPATNLSNAGVMTPAQQVHLYNQVLDANGPYFPWRFAFYNKVDDVSKYRKPDKMSNEMWLQALERNPDPTCYVPVLAEDFTGLHQRMKLQEDVKKEQQKNLQQYKEYAENLQQHHAVSTMVKIENFKRRQTELTSRVVHLMVRLELLRSRGQSLTREEEQFRMQLENIQRELNQPNQYKACLNEIISSVRMQEDYPPQAYPSIQDEDLKRFQEILIPQGEGLQAILDILKKDTEDINIMLESYSNALGAVRR